jgi:hypothetical protein
MNIRLSSLADRWWGSIEVCAYSLIGGNAGGYPGGASYEALY